MALFKNTNSFPVTFPYNSVMLMVSPFSKIKLEETKLSAGIPDGFKKIDEDQKMLTEIDPYTTKRIAETPEDTSTLLLG